MILIPVGEISTNIAKESHLGKNYEGEFFNKIAIYSTISGICILLELITAMLGFIYLSWKYKIKFQINQVVVHIAMIVSITISRFAGWYSEDIFLRLAHLYTKERTKELH